MSIEAKDFQPTSTTETSTRRLRIPRSVAAVVAGLTLLAPTAACGNCNAAGPKESTELAGDASPSPTDGPSWIDNPTDDEIRAQ